MLPKKFYKIFYKYIFLISITFSNISCNQPTIYEHKALIFGTILEIKFYDVPQEKIDLALKKIIFKLEDLNKKFHPWEDSLINKFNNSNELIECDDDFTSILKKAKEYEIYTSGSFNPAIGEIIKLWGFHTDNIKGKIPEANDIKVILDSNPSMKQIKFNDLCLSKNNEQLKIDLGGMIKGLSLDIAKQVYNDLDIKNVLTNFGGNVYAHGKPKKRFWEIAIINPIDNKKLLAKLELMPGETIGTSGDYEKYFLHDNRKYSHLIDPKNGYPGTNFSSVTIVIPPGKDAGIKSDVLSKPLFFSQNINQTSKVLDLDLFLLTDHKKNILISEKLLKRINWLFENGEFNVKTI